MLKSKSWVNFWNVPTKQIPMSFISFMPQALASTEITTKSFQD